MKSLFKQIAIQVLCSRFRGDGGVVWGQAYFAFLGGGGNGGPELGKNLLM